MSAQLVPARPERGKGLEAPRYLVRDGDSIYGTAVTRRLRAMGIRDKPIAPGSPWQNGFVERLIHPGDFGRFRTVSTRAREGECELGTLAIGKRCQERISATGWAW
jgi:transposase InsO family protein